VNSTDFETGTYFDHPVLGALKILAVGQNWLDVQDQADDRFSISKQMCVQTDPDWPFAKLEMLSAVIMTCQTIAELKSRTPALDSESRQQRRKLIECNFPTAFNHLLKLEGKAPLQAQGEVPMLPEWTESPQLALIRAMDAEGDKLIGVSQEAIALALQPE
jgi:hypothetical protein